MNYLAVFAPFKKGTHVEDSGRPGVVGVVVKRDRRRLHVRFPADTWHGQDEEGVIQYDATHTRQFISKAVGRPSALRKKAPPPVRPKPAAPSVTLRRITAYQYQGRGALYLVAYDYAAGTRHRYTVVKLTLREAEVIGRELDIDTVRDVIRSHEGDVALPW